jgi:hypothetical protein
MSGSPRGPIRLQTPRCPGLDTVDAPILDELWHCHRMPTWARQLISYDDKKLYVFAYLSVSLPRTQKTSLRPLSSSEPLQLLVSLLFRTLLRLLLFLEVGSVSLEVSQLFF